MKTRERILDDDGKALVEAEFGIVLWDPEQPRLPADHRRRAHRAGERRRMSWNSDPVVVTCAITGADVFRENNPNIPYTTEEIANSAIEAGEAGATIAHLHVREDDGTPSGRPELFVDVIDRIRAESPILTMVSTGGSNDMTIEERTTGLEAKPDISGVESGSMNFGDETFITPPPAGAGSPSARRTRASRSRSRCSTSATS